MWMLYQHFCIDSETQPMQMKLVLLKARPRHAMARVGELSHSTGGASADALGTTPFCEEDLL